MDAIMEATPADSFGPGISITGPEIAGPAPRHRTVGVTVGEGEGAVTVGGGAPVVVQSMTNTDTADIDAHRGAGRRRCRGRAPNLCASRSTATRRPPPSRRSVTARPHRRSRAAGGRLPLYRPQAPLRSSGLCRGTGQIPDQSGQCRFQGEEGHAVLDHRRAGGPLRQDHSHRRQLGFPRRGAAHPSDGTRTPGRAPHRCPRRDARGHGALGIVLGPAGRRARSPQEPDHPLGQGLGGAGSDRGLPRSRPALGLRDPSRPHRSRHGLEGAGGGLGGHRRASAGRHRRHDPLFADARARRRPDRRGQGISGTPADHGLPHLRADGRCLPGCGRTTSTTFRNSPATSRTGSSPRCRNGRRPIRASKV